VKGHRISESCGDATHVIELQRRGPRNGFNFRALLQRAPHCILGIVWLKGQVALRDVQRRDRPIVERTQRLLWAPRSGTVVAERLKQRQ